MAMANINTEIKETTLKLIKLVSNAIVEDLKDNSSSVLDVDDIIDTMLEAYNMWQKDTHDGVDYIFTSMKQLKTKLIDNTEWAITHLFLFANNTDTYHKIFNMYIGNLFGA